jgi:hypothetical protein
LAELLIKNNPQRPVRAHCLFVCLFVHVTPTSSPIETKPRLPLKAVKQSQGFFPAHRAGHPIEIQSGNGNQEDVINTILGNPLGELRVDIVSGN